MSTELVIIENVNALEVFSTDKGLDPIIEKIKEQVRSEHLDVSTEDGRKRIASVARKIGSAKVTLENMALELTEDWRKKTNAVNAEKKRMKDELDTLRDEVKAPLDEYRQREAKRVEAFETRIDGIKNADMFEFPDPTAEMIEQRIELLENMINHEWEEFAQRAHDTYKESKSRLEVLLESRKKRDAEQAELERLRKEAAAREQAERDERIAKEAAEKARIEAEQKAQREREEAERKAKAEQDRLEAQAKAAEQARIDAENKAKADAERAEQERIAAEKRAQAEKDAAIKAERDRQEAERKAEAEAIAKREADKAHKAKINGAAANKIADIAGITYDQAMGIVDKISNGEVPNIKVIY